MAKKDKKYISILWIAILVIGALSPSSPYTSIKKIFENEMNNNSNATPLPYANLFPLTEEQTSWVDSVMQNMTTRDKCAQMVMTWVLGEYMNEDSKEFKRVNSLVKDQKIGGLIFFKGNILNEAILINKMQRISDVPLLISSDFERGLAMRLTDAIEFPYNMAVAATGDKNLAYEMGKAVSEECRAIGVHQNYAPVADVNNNAKNPIINIRSFSEDKDIVSDFCRSYIAGATELKVISTVKHFPGHGDTQIDSHQDMPTIAVDKLNLANNELVPFSEAIKAGVQSVMIGHLNVPAIDPSGLPATLSKRVITDLLKNEMEFNGLIVTDAMNMNAVTNYFSVGEAAVKAVLAGNDMVLMPPDEEIAVTAIYQAVLAGEISSSRIDESVRKILTAKKWLGIDNGQYSDINEISNTVNSEHHKLLAEEIAEKSITLVKNDNHLLPLDPSKIYQTACITISEGLGT